MPGSQTFLVASCRKYAFLNKNISATVSKPGSLINEGAKMSGSSTIALLALMAMVAFYSMERSIPLARLGFAAACLIAAVSDFALGHWPFGVVALGFCLIAVQKWNSGRHRHGHA
jgi:hypothetical protein